MKNTIILLITFTVLLSTGSTLHAQTAEQKKQEELRQEFAGINFGIGISLTHDLGSNDRVQSAFLDENGIVRISEQRNDIARIMLETHYFFKPEVDDTELFGVSGDMWGHGPFIALQPGTDDIIEAIGIGWMIGFRKDKDTSESFNLGIGYVVDPSVSVLGDNVTANQLLPDGETNLRLKKTSQGGLLLLASFNF